jgi:hypothetical protein
MFGQNIQAPLTDHCLRPHRLGALSPKPLSLWVLHPFFLHVLIVTDPATLNTKPQTLDPET